jgi:Arc/MetJ-type ribon-helix-helix transcriptional regulator
MVIDLEPEQQRVIDLAIQSGVFHNSKEVIATALSMLAEDIEDGAVSEARSHEPRSTLAEVEAELRALGGSLESPLIDPTSGAVRQNRHT